MPTDSPASSRPDNTAYWIALGQFVQTYSAVEAEMQILLWERARVTSEVARAIFSGVRVKEAMSHIKRIYEAENGSGYEIIEPAFKQLADITAARNDILHFGSKFVGGKPQYVTNQRLAHTPDRMRRFPVSAEILNHMTHDLSLIMTRIEMMRYYGTMPDGSFHEAFGREFAVPWLYRHAPQAGDQDTPPAPGPGRKDPPESSQG